MALPNVFSPGQVFTAANANLLRSNQYNQTVTTKTASYTPTTTTDIGTRVIMNSASATTITINTSIYTAGDTFFISNIGAGVCTLTAGTCTITSAGPLAIPQYGGGLLYFTSASAAIYYPSAGPAATSGLTRLASGTATAASRISFTNIFSATYKNYRVILSNIANAQDNNKIYLFVGTGGTPEVQSGTYVMGQIKASGTSTLGYNRVASDFYLNGNIGTANNAAIFEVMNPQVAKYTMVKISSLGTYTGLVYTIHENFGQIQTTTQYTDMFFENDSATNIGAIDYAIYGYEA